MTKIMIHFSAITDVYAFVGIVTKYPYDVDLCSGRYTVDGKSIMGVFSLDLLSDIQAVIYDDDPKELIAEIDKYIIK